jgi:AcrR family transcriptional regulator
MATKRTSTTEARVPLSRERVLDAAIALADAGGIECLSMRKLAKELGVEAMSLYNHVANKGDLVDAIVDRVIDEIELPESADDEWEAAIRTCAVSAHEAFVRHPWACSPAMSPARSITAPAARIRYVEWLLGRLRRGGFSAALTFHAYHALDSHILGFTMWELGHAVPSEESAKDLMEAFFREFRGDEFPYLLEHAAQHRDGPGDEGPNEFEFGLNLILDSLKRAHEEGGPTGAPVERAKRSENGG